MWAYFERILDSSMFSPHGICLLWEPELIWLHAVSDAAIAAAYFSIPFALAILVTKRRDLQFGWVFWAFALALLVASPLAAQVTVIKAGRLVDTERGTVATNQIVIVRNGRIEEVGPSLAIPAGAKVIDLSAMTVLPGLIDSHTHLSDGMFDSDGDPRTVLFHTVAEDVLAAIPNVKTTLMAGFTTVRDVGTYRALNDVAMRDAINKGIIPGPRMYVAGAYITITGGAGAMTGISPDVQLPLDMRYGEANSPWEVRQKVRLLVSQGVNVIKVLSTGAVLTHGSNKQSQEFTPEELAAAVDEAHQFGLKVAAHAHSAQGIKNAVRAGVVSSQRLLPVSTPLVQQVAQVISA